MLLLLQIACMYIQTLTYTNNTERYFSFVRIVEEHIRYTETELNGGCGGWRNVHQRVQNFNDVGWIEESTAWRYQLSL